MLLELCRVKLNGAKFRIECCIFTLVIQHVINEADIMEEILFGINSLAEPWDHEYGTAKKRISLSYGCSLLKTNNFELLYAN